MKLKVTYYGNPILRKKAIKVDKITDEIITLVNDMIETMDAHRGIGLAASQVGSLHRLFVIRPEIVDQHGDFALGAPEVFINPKLSNPSKEMQSITEGCLSFPGLHIDIERPKEIHIEAMNLKGEIIKEKAVGIKAIEVMHENDHLNGVLFIDRIKDPKVKKRLDPILLKMKKNFKNL